MKQDDYYKLLSEHFSGHARDHRLIGGRFLLLYIKASASDSGYVWYSLLHQCPVSIPYYQERDWIDASGDVLITVRENCVPHYDALSINNPDDVEVPKHGLYLYGRRPSSEVMYPIESFSEKDTKVEWLQNSDIRVPKDFAPAIEQAVKEFNAYLEKESGDNPAENKRSPLSTPEMAADLLRRYIEDSGKAFDPAPIMKESLIVDRRIKKVGNLAIGDPVVFPYDDGPNSDKYMTLTGFIDETLAVCCIVSATGRFHKEALPVEAIRRIS